jgi:hypothetical protein
MKDSRIAEWWCSANTHGLVGSSSSRVSFTEIDAALEAWRRRALSAHSPGMLPLYHDFATSLKALALKIKESIISLSPEYNFHYTKFCLNTHFVQHISSATPEQSEIEAIRRCIDCARDVLSLAGKVGPVWRDQLRYFPGFPIVALSYCSSFILSAIQTFPTIFGCLTAELEIVKTLAIFLIDLGAAGSQEALAAGRSVLLRHHRVLDLLSRTALVISGSNKEEDLQTAVHNPRFDQDKFQVFEPEYEFPVWDFHIGTDLSNSTNIYCLTLP